ncbi:hypothetical protein Tco_1256313 [Tanacetum coccineum]
MIQPEPEDLPKDNPKLEIAVLRILHDVRGRVGASPTKPMVDPWDGLMNILVESNDEGVTVVSELVIPPVNPDVYGNRVPLPLVSMDGAPGCKADGSGIAVVAEKSDICKITKGTREGLGRQYNIKACRNTNNDSSDSISWTSSNDDKTESDNDSGDGDNIAQMEHFGVLVHGKEKQSPTLKPHSPSITSSSLEDVSRYMNEHPDDVMTKLIEEPVYTETISEFIQPRFKSTMKQALKSTPISLSKPTTTSLYDLSKYELKDKLFHLMHKNKSLQQHEHHLDLYNVMNSMAIDKLVAQGELDLTPTLRKRSHDDQDPLKNHDGETKKRRRKNTSGSSSQKDKAPVDTSNYDIFSDANEPQ